MTVVRAWVHFTADRAMNVIVEGPDGPVDAGLTRRSGDLARIAREKARTLWQRDEINLELIVDRAPWLRKGSQVELSTVPAGAAHPYGDVVGFLPLGRVLVRHPETGDGVHGPEDVAERV